MLVNADFHVHSCFSSASSKDMLIKNMAPKSKLKGLQLLGTGDAFHPGWLNIIEESTTYSGDGIYTADGMDFVLTTEVEGKNRIHHLIIIPDIDIARELSDKLVSKNKAADGRPRTRYSGAELLEMVRQYDCLIGPAHAFTPGQECISHMIASMIVMRRNLILSNWDCLQTLSWRILLVNLRIFHF